MKLLCFRSTILFFNLALLITSLHAQEQNPPPHKNSNLPVEARVQDLLGRMTLEEKVAMVGGTGFATKPNARLEIPELKMADGPVGVRWGKATAFPASIAMAASWDTALVQRIGQALAREAKAKGRNVLLGPCINIHRVPHGGRNFESFGEDPYLTARLAVAYIRGVQSEKIVATPKHFACNNQEWERGTISVKIDERALREIYLPAFKAAIQEAGAWSIMSAYNKVNGTYCSENSHLLTEILKNEWGFKGFVMSDWGAVHSTIETANAGLDLEMPFGQYLGNDLLEAVKTGKVQAATLDDKIARMLRIMFVAGWFDRAAEANAAPFDSTAHRELARAAAREGIVLLKNANNILPLQRNKLKSVAVIGPNAAMLRFGGGGSSAVTPFFAVSPLEGIKNKTGNKIRVHYALGCELDGDIQPIDSAFLLSSSDPKSEHGLRGEYFGNKDLQGTPVLTRLDQQIAFDWMNGAPAQELKSDGFSVRWTGKLAPKTSGAYRLSVMSDDGVRLYFNNTLVIDDWRDHAAETRSAKVDLQAGASNDLRLEYYESGGDALVKLGWSKLGNDLITEAAAAARNAEVALVFAGLSKHFESEGFDRQSLDLPEDQIALINAVAAANSKTIVVLNSGAPVLMSQWLDRVSGLIEAWFPGQEGGDAIADVIFGDFNPGGKLPATFLKEWQDSPAYSNYPGKDGVVDYAEGIFVGYRHFDKNNLAPLFPFGFGLSYTTFAYSDLTITSKKNLPTPEIEAAVTVKNTGPREGTEVVQLYVHEVKSKVARPIKELKGFQKIALRPGESKRLAFTLDQNAFSFYDVNRKQWVIEPGQFEILIGSSSRDIRVQASIALQ
ncbi:MAG: glycoside hydrolase family 3 C-terminal domain-containing protein [bacterium]